MLRFSILGLRIIYEHIKQNGIWFNNPTENSHFLKGHDSEKCSVFLF